MTRSTADPAAASREFDFSNQDFDRVRALIHGHAGIALADTKREMVYSRLARRLRAAGVRTFREYLARLESGDAREWEAFTNSLTTNLTSFFREAHHFPILAEHAARRKPAAPIVLWSCAASTGEEPYSMAMTLVETFRSFTPPARILATDVDTGVLRQAEAGVNAAERVQALSAERVRQFFEPVAGEAGRVRVREALRRLVEFRALNLLDTRWPIDAPLDAIFCRNVMIYFDRPTQNRILRRFAPLLESDGLLFAGHSESFLDCAEFRLRGKTVYQLAGAAAVRK